MVLGYALILANVMFAYMNFTTGYPYFGLFNACAAAFVLFEMRRR
jgi:hypothetical protein